MEGYIYGFHIFILKDCNFTLIKLLLLKHTSGIKEVSQLSIVTAIKLFNLKISPIAFHAVEIIWLYLTKKDLENL